MPNQMETRRPQIHSHGSADREKGRYISSGIVMWICSGYMAPEYAVGICQLSATLASLSWNLSLEERTRNLSLEGRRKDYNLSPEMQILRWVRHCFYDYVITSFMYC
jgi:hypothetical protein